MLLLLVALFALLLEAVESVGLMWLKFESILFELAFKRFELLLLLLLDKEHEEVDEGEDVEDDEELDILLAFKGGECIVTLPPL
jgi:hypothetical protein